MGLDMYLSVHRSTYLKKGNRTIDLDNLNANFDDYDSDEFGCSNSVEVIEQFGYWRKANAIHRWFVNNVQEGEDNCRDYWVSDKKIDTLLSVCKTILDKLDGTKFTIDEKTKEWYDSQNTEAKKKGEKIPYPYKEKLVFTKKNLKKFYSNNCIYNYSCELNKDIKDYINKNLKPTEGFFFGSTKIDGGYFWDVIKTILIIERLKKKIKVWKKNKEFYDIYYQSSW